MELLFDLNPLVSWKLCVLNKSSLISSSTLRKIFTNPDLKAYHTVYHQGWSRTVKHSLRSCFLVSDTHQTDLLCWLEYHVRDHQKPLSDLGRCFSFSRLLICFQAYCVRPCAPTALMGTFGANMPNFRLVHCSQNLRSP